MLIRTAVAGFWRFRPKWKVSITTKQGAGRKYHKNIREKALKDPVNHNFPYSFDEIILKTKPTIVRGGGRGYALRGTQNGKDVIYNIIEKDGVIVHRDVINVKQWAQRSKKFGWPVNLEDISKDVK